MSGLKPRPTRKIPTRNNGVWGTRAIARMSVLKCLDYNPHAALKAAALHLDLTTLGAPFPQDLDGEAFQFFH